MLAPWLLIALLSWMGLGRTAAIWGFWKGPPPAKAVTMSQRMTPVVSKFKLLTEVVITNMHHFSSSIWIGWDNGTGQFHHQCSGRGRLSCSLNQASVLTHWLVLHLKFGWEDCGVSPLRGRSKWWGMMPHVSQTPAEFDSTLPMPVMVGWGHQLIVPGSILPRPWTTSCLQKTTCSFTLSFSSRMLLAKGQKSRLAGGLSLSA